MKSKIKKIAIAISVFAISLISSTQVFALSNNLTMNKTTTYYNRYGSDGNNASWYWTKYNFENRTAYCIEPGIKEGTIYNQGDWNNTGLSNSIRTRVYLLAYYGYDYPGHQTDSYRMATQAMIWEAVLGNTSVSFSSGRWNAGDQIDVSAERNQIESLIANHYTRPSFNGQTINLNVGETTTLTDTNNVLEKFDISVSGAEYSVNGNTLTIKPTQVGDIQIRMIKKTYTSEAPVIFYGDGIQNMVVGGAIDPVVSSISIHSVGGKLNISKKDLDNRNNTPQGDAKLTGTVYGLYDETGKLIEKLTITEAESIQSNTLPSLGRFYIQEITPGEGYQLDDTKYYFNSTLDNINASLELFDKVINRNYDITKVYADAETKIMTPEPNVEFGFYNSTGELYKKATTDSNGRLVINLVYGKYTVKQLTSTPNYEKVDDFEIEVKEMGDVIYKVISNAEITSKLKVVKIDKETGNVITRAGIKFKIKNLKTGEYVCQNITYPTTQKVCVFETDENGVFITPYALDSGTYQLEEVDQVIDGYLWNKESLPFEIGENSQVVKDENYGIIFEVQFENQRVKGKVEINKIGEELVIGDGTYSYNKISLENVKYGIYANEDIKVNGKIKYHKDDLIETIVTDENGYASLNDLELGKYYALELESSSNNVLDNTKYLFELKYKDQYTAEVIQSLNLENHYPKGTIEFTKTDLATGEVIPNTKIEIYTDKDELVFTGVTDENGKVTITDLFPGTFYIKETEAATGYQISDEKVYFEITDDGEIVKANMTNELIVEVPNTLTSESKVLPIAGISLMLLGLGVGIYAINKNKKK